MLIINTIQKASNYTMQEESGLITPYPMRLILGVGRLFFDLQLSKENLAMTAPSAAAATMNEHAHTHQF